MDRVAIFHDYLTQMGGAERVTGALVQAFPHASLHTTMTARGKLSPEFRARPIRTTWMQALPAPQRWYRHYFLLYPLAVESADLRDYDVIISSCCGYSKGVRKRVDAVHVCYCHTPMRCVWRYDDYVARERFGRLRRRLLPWLIRPLRRWDLRASKRPDFFIANSAAVAERIRRFYGRDAVVIPPPIDLDMFQTSPTRGDFYLVISRLVAYKRIELAIEACNRLGRRLVIVGDGPDRERLQRMSGPTIDFLGRQPDSRLGQLASEARALLFPGEEDFGMVPLEANASGRPVVAWKGGGALETVEEGKTGVFFTEPSARALARAIEDVERREWDAEALRRHAAAYDRALFIARIRAFVSAARTGVPPRSVVAGTHA